MVSDVGRTVNTSSLPPPDFNYFSKVGYLDCQYTWVESAHKCVSFHSSKTFPKARQFCQDEGHDILCLGDWVGQFDAFRTWLQDTQSPPPYYYHLGLVYDYHSASEPS